MGSNSTCSLGPDLTSILNFPLILNSVLEQSMIKDLQELVKKQSEYMSRILAMQNLGDKLSVVSFQSPEGKLLAIAIAL